MDNLGRFDVIPLIGHYSTAYILANVNMTEPCFVTADGFFTILNVNVFGGHRIASLCASVHLLSVMTLDST